MAARKARTRATTRASKRVPARQSAAGKGRSAARRDHPMEAPAVATKHDVKSKRQKSAHGRPAKPKGQHVRNTAKSSLAGSSDRGTTRRGAKRANGRGTGKP